ncbi:MAG: DUF6364 family protein [Gammaproteobacteria bacterium]|nr:DUF6364 family protein [Gammaproteobacteria bacterium]
MNITLSIDEQVVADARRIAARRGTSLNRMIRDYLLELTQPRDRQATVEQLDSLWSTSRYRSSAAWTRDELHERA